MGVKTFCSLVFVVLLAGCQKSIEQRELKYPDGTLREVWSEDADGLKQGLATTYYPDGKKQTEGEFVNDYLEGRFRMWDKQGNIIADGIYKHGQEWEGTFIAGNQFTRRVQFKKFKEGRLVSSY